MDLSIGGIVRQVVAPVVDAVSLARTGAVEQIASFLRDNPDQRGTVETALASSGRTGDLSAIVERAGLALGQTVARTTDAVTQATHGATTAIVQAADRATTAVAQVADRAGGAVATTAQPVVAQAARTLAQPIGQNPAQPGGSAAALLGRALPAASEGAGRAVATTADAAALARSGPEPGRAGPPVDGRAVAADARPSNTIAPLLAGRAEAGSVRGGDAIGGAIREGRLALLVGIAIREGQVGALVADARAAGQLPALVAAVRTIDGALAAFASRGGLSATELALFARAGMLSPAETHALRAAGVPIDVEEQLPTQVAPRDGPAEDRIDADPTVPDGVPVAGFADPALARFDAGAIRIVSRAAVETYGVLGPPGGTVLAVDAFEALLRRVDGDLISVERHLGLPKGTLGDPDTLVAFVERRDLAGLRRAEAAALAGWQPGGEQAGGIAAALADLGGAVPFREMRFAGQAR